MSSSVASTQNGKRTGPRGTARVRTTEIQCSVRGRTGRIKRPRQRGISILIFLPFLIIDLVVAAILMSMGMMMVPPAIVSLPFKLAFFAVADGWTLISGALVRSYF